MNAPQKYAITEIFHSLQGEGFFTGTPAVFIRFSGCNLACSFCDTLHPAREFLTSGQILERISASDARHLILTGGEPSLQIDTELVDALHTKFPFIQIETNGTNPVPENIDWVTVSPKPSGIKGVNRIDELKIVFTGQDVETIREEYPCDNCFLQPCSGENISETVDYILAHPWWRLSLQTHKIIDIP